MNVLITGVDGLLGWHLRCRLHAEKSVVVVPCSRTDFSVADKLTEMLRTVDAVVHFAGVNRGNEVEVERANIAIAEQLSASLSHSGAAPQIVYASSVHQDRDTAYGRSKRRAGEILRSGAESAGSVMTWLTLPHVFGEGGKPYYNSVVSTFCHQLAARETPRIQNDGELELLHAQQVAEIVLAQLRSKEPRVRPRGIPLRVSELLARLQSLASDYREKLIPNLSDPMDLRLFNTYRSYLFPSAYPVELEIRRDLRGELFESVRAKNGGQSFFSLTRPGITRGNHYHRRKVERFLVVSGNARIRLRRLFRDTATEFVVSGDRPVYIDMPTLHTHSITNVGSSDLMTLFWTNEIYDPNDADTFAEEV